MKCILACILPAAALAAAEAERVWDFETPVAGWAEPAGYGQVVAEPGRADNHAYRIATDRPHHTQLVLDGSERTADFVATVRFRVLESTGESPGVYVYGRLAAGNFRGLVVQGGQARAFCYFGQEAPSVSLGAAALPAPLPGGWTWARLACYGDHVLAKVWPEGSREPRWQMRGRCPGQETGRFALGVWTSPRVASSATVLFDDVGFRPLGAADLAGLGIRLGPRPPAPESLFEAAPGIVRGPGFTGLASARSVLVFDAARGEIAHLLDRASRSDGVAPEVFHPLFRLGLTRPYAGESLELTAEDFAAFAISPSGPAGLRLTFSGCESVPSLRVRVDVRVREDGLFGFRAGVEQAGAWAVARIDLPLLAFPPSLGADPEAEALVLPWADGAVLPEPGTRSQSRSAVYPGHAFCQFTAYANGRMGLYLAAYDTEGHGKRWNLRTAAGTAVEMTLSHLRPEEPASEVELPYETVLGTYRGDWRDGADLYKEWACRQWWCAKTLDQRPDIPSFLTEGSSILIGSVHNPEGRERLVGANLERLPELTASYRERTGLPHIVFVPYGWENRGTWAGINYLPAVPSNEAWRRATAALRAQGDRVAFMTSGYWWVVKRKQTGNGPAFDDSEQFERLRGMVIHRADGSPFLVDHHEQTGQFGDWRGLSASLCHGSAEASATLRDLFLAISGLGVSLISFDQEIGGGQSAPCYHGGHGHPPGYGRWMWTGFRDVCQEILARRPPDQPELGLFLENVSELAIPWMATYWSRQFGEVDHGAAGARGVGLFSYLYHEYVTAIGAACVQGQGKLGTRPHPGLRRIVLANNLVRGLIPGPFLNDVPLEPTSEWQREVAPAYFAYCRPYAHFPEYLLRGRTFRPPRVACASVELWYYRDDPRGEPLRPGGPRVSRVTVALPAVVAGSFEAADGSVATFVVNTTLEPQRVELSGLPGQGPAAVCNAQRVEVEHWPSIAGPEPRLLTLGPLDVRVVVVAGRDGAPADAPAAER